MAANSYTQLALMENGNTDQNVIQVDESKFYMPMRDLRALTAWTTGRKRESGRVKVGGLKRKVFERFPHQRDVTVTAAASISDVTLTVDESGMMVQNGTLYDPVSDQSINLSANPPSSTSVTVTALSKAIAAGTVLKYSGMNIKESWSRGRSVVRATGFHEDYISGKQRLFGFSWHDQYREKYIKGDAIRVEEDAYREFEEDLNHELWFGTGEESDAVGKSRTRGLYSLGMQYGWIPCPGVLTRSLLNQGVSRLYSNSNARSCEVITGQRLATELSLAINGTGLRRYNEQDENPMDGRMSKSAKSTVENIGLSFETDHVFDSAGQLEQCVALVNWDNLKSLYFGVPYFQKGVQDPGTGDFLHQMTRHVGFQHGLLNGSIVLFTNVNEWRP